MTTTTTLFPSKPTAKEAFADLNSFRDYFADYRMPFSNIGYKVMDVFNGKVTGDEAEMAIQAWLDRFEDLDAYQKAIREDNYGGYANAEEANKNCEGRLNQLCDNHIYFQSLTNDEDWADVEYVEFNCGTSLARANAFVNRGGGVVLLERGCYIPEIDAVSVYGLQVSATKGNGPMNNGSRNSMARITYYARRQAELTNDIPVHLSGYIEKKYVFRANNGGEYSIPEEYYSHIINPQIIRI